MQAKNTCTTVLWLVVLLFYVQLVYKNMHVLESWNMHRHTIVQVYVLKFEWFMLNLAEWKWRLPADVGLQFYRLMLLVWIKLSISPLSFSISVTYKNKRNKHCHLSLYNLYQHQVVSCIILYQSNEISSIKWRMPVPLWKFRR